MATTGRSAGVIIWLVLLLLCGSQSASGQSGRAFIEGYVIGDAELSGISGARVDLIGDPKGSYVRGVRLQSTTDSTGKYSITEIPHGPYTLRISAPGYVAYEIPIYMLSDTKTQLHAQLKKETRAHRRRHR